MQITKEFRINEVRATSVSRAPFEIVLEGNPFRREEKSSLILDTDTCTRHNIPMSLDLVGRTLVCSFESRELLLTNMESLGHDGWFKEQGGMDNDDLAIQSLKRNEIMSPSLGTIPPSKRNDTSRTLTLISLSSIDSDIMPCPFYRFVLELTEKEYEDCKALSAKVVFKASFRLT